MTFLFPFNKEDGSAFSEQSEFEELLRNQKFGQFGFNPSNLSWHGGVHFTAENAPWLKDERPLQAMMDGRVVACRISSQYLSSQFNEHELQYSGDYCLLQHQVEDPKHSGSFFTFYALYMHLAPLCLEHRTFSDFPRYRLLSNRNARLDVGLSGTAFELGINAIIEATPTSPIIKDGYQFKQFTVIRSQVESLKDKTVWLAIQKESKPNDVRSLFLNRAELLGAEKEDSSSYLLLKSARTYWLEPNIESPKATLNANTLLQESELSPVRCGDYEMRAYERINYGVGLDSSCVKTGEVIWFVTAKYEALENLFPNFAESYNPPSWLMTKVVAKIKVTGLQGRADPRYDGTKLIAGGKAYEVPKGTIIMFDKTRDWSFQKIGQKMRLMAKCRFHPNTPIIDLRGQAVPYLWICVEDEYIEPQQSYGLELDTTHCFGNQSSLFVKAGDDIGYLGRYDVTSIQENEPPVTTRYQVHFELLSSEPPPQFFIDMFLGKQEPDTETPYRIIEDYSNCDGYLNLKDEPSSFFKKLNEVYEKEEYQVKSTDIVKNFTAWDSCKNVIAKHESEWAKPASEKSFLDKLIKIVNNPKFDTLIEHEKERIDKLIWLPDVKKLGLENDVWNWWPIFEPKPSNGKITANMLRKIWTSKRHVSDYTLNKIAIELNSNLEKCNINSEVRLYHFISQIFQETGLELRLSENLNYSASSLPIFFSYYRKHPNEQQIDGRTATHPANQKNIANKAYGSRNGNNKPGDGWRYRGRGMKQLTGKNNYKEFTTYSKLKWNSSINFVLHPELLSDNIIYAVRSALFYWDKNKMYTKADLGFTEKASIAVTNIINSGLSREQKLIRYKNLEKFHTQKIFMDVFN